jgi:hypothetical protein
MGVPNLEKNRAEFMEAASGMYDDLRQWRANHPEASIDEIANQITPKRRALMGQLLVQLACQHGDGEVIVGVACPECGEAMSYKGKPSRDVIHKEGEEELVRSYYHCARCQAGLFPPG